MRSIPGVQHQPESQHDEKDHPCIDDVDTIGKFGHHQRIPEVDQYTCGLDGQASQ